MKLETMQDLFVEQIEDLYDAEKRLVKALPKMAQECTSDRLRVALEEHLEETKGHVDRLERVFQALQQDAKGQTCQAMKGLIDEGEDVISDTEPGPLRDAGMIAAGNRVEHYEIAAYGSARTFAQTLGMLEVAELLEETLEEEKAADEKLTEIATSMVNEQALVGSNERR